MNTIHTETLSAFVDGEPVDLTHLEAALEDADARRALIDFARLRDAARSDVAPLPASLVQLCKRKPSGGVLRWTAAAAALVLMFIAGLLTPDAWRADADRRDPPQPTRIEKFIPGVDWRQGD